MWVLGANFSKMQTLPCLYHQWLLVGLKITIKIPVTAYGDGPAPWQPQEPLILTTEQLSLPHSVLEGVMLCPTTPLPPLGHPAHSGKPTPVPQGGPAPCHSQPPYLDLLLRSVPSPVPLLLLEFFDACPPHRPLAPGPGGAR